MKYICAKCQMEKDESDFHKKNHKYDVKRKCSYYCKDCQQQYIKKFREANKEKIAKDKYNYALKLKSDGITEYGGKCVCCGENEPKFLTIDHIDGRIGDEKTERVKWSGKKMWAKLKKLGYPKDNYQLLCFNCNCTKGIYGVCAHKLEGKECVAL